MTWFNPGPSFGYVLKQIDDHPWDTIITMKEVLKLQPGSIRFVGPVAGQHRDYWKPLQPGLIETGVAPVFVLDTAPIHPRTVENKPRKPFEPWKI
jgi:hypothetical protein